MAVPFEASYELWERRVRDVFARQGTMAHIGAALVEVRPGYCSIALPFRREVAQHHDYFHAGMTSTIADSTGGYAALSLFPAGSDVLTVEFKIKSHRTGPRLCARGGSPRRAQWPYLNGLQRRGLRRTGRDALPVRAAIPFTRTILRDRRRAQTL